MSNSQQVYGAYPSRREDKIKDPRSSPLLSVHPIDLKVISKKKWKFTVDNLFNGNGDVLYANDIRNMLTNHSWKDTDESSRLSCHSPCNQINDCVSPVTAEECIEELSTIQPTSSQSLLQRDNACENANNKSQSTFCEQDTGSSQQPLGYNDLKGHEQIVVNVLGKDVSSDIPVEYNPSDLTPDNAQKNLPESDVTENYQTNYINQDESLSTKDFALLNVSELSHTPNTSVTVFHDNYKNKTKLRMRHAMKKLKMIARRHQHFPDLALFKPKWLLNMNYTNVYDAESNSYKHSSFGGLYKQFYRSGQPKFQTFKSFKQKSVCISRKRSSKLQGKHNRTTNSYRGVPSQCNPFSEKLTQGCSLRMRSLSLDKEKLTSNCKAIQESVNTAISDEQSQVRFCNIDQAIECDKQNSFQHAWSCYTPSFYSVNSHDYGLNVNTPASDDFQQPDVSTRVFQQPHAVNCRYQQIPRSNMCLSRYQCPFSQHGYRQATSAVPVPAYYVVPCSFNMGPSVWRCNNTVDGFNHESNSASTKQKFVITSN